MARCMGCMAEIDDERFCPHCGFDTEAKQNLPLLALGTVINGRYLIGKVLNSNGESTCYTAFDNFTDKKIIVREFFPVGIAARGYDGITLYVNETNSNLFNNLYNEFNMYFQAVMGLKGYGAIGEISELITCNNTIYVIEPDCELIIFDEYIAHMGGKIDWDTARPLFMPLISLLQAMHKYNIGHYAIGPENLFVTPMGKIRLRGFATESARKQGTVLKPELIDGISAPEQYAHSFNLDEKTEVYGVTACIFYALTGSLPENAQKRISDGKLLMSTQTAKRLPPYVINALVSGLQTDRISRTETLDELKTALSAASTVEAIKEEISKTAVMNNKKNKDEKKRKSRVPVFIISFIVTALIILTVYMIFYSNKIFKNTPDAATPPATTPSASVATNSATDSGAVVEDYVGRSYTDVVASLENSRIEIVRSYETVYSDVYGAGVIVKQQPTAGTPIVSSDGSATIYVEVSSGPLMRELPEIDGKALDEATDLINERGFLVYQIEEYSSTVATGYVVGYDGYVAGDKLEAGTAVIIRVSKGKAPVNETATFNPNAVI